MKRIILWLVALLAVACLSLGLFACNGVDPVDSDKGALKITFDETATYTADDIADIADILNITDAAGNKVKYDVVGSKVTDDGGFIDVTVSVDGKEQTVRLPYSASDEPGSEQGNEPVIRTDLQALYDLLGKAGAKGYSIALSGNARENAEADVKSFGVKAIVNTGTSDGMQVAIFTGEENAQGVITYDNTVFALSGIDFDASKLEQLAALFGSGIDFDEIMSDDDEISTADAEDGDIVGADAPVDTVGAVDEDDLYTTFIKLSSYLNTLDDFVAHPQAIELFGVNLTKQGNVYTAQADLYKVIGLLELAFPNSEIFEEISVDEIREILDEQLDGALSEGKIKVTVSFELTANGANVSLVVENEKTGAKGTLSAAFAVSDTAFVIPSEVMGRDLDIGISFALPQKEIALNLDAVLHLSDLFVAGKDIVTGTLAYNDVEDAIIFVLNDGYIYADATGIFKEFDIQTTSTFYEAFEKDGKPVSFYEMLIDADPHDKTDGESDLRFRYGFGAMPKDSDDGVVVLTVGATEEDLRDAISVFVFDEDDEMIDFPDYEIKNFDGTQSYFGEVTIVLADGYSIDLMVRVYDPANVRVSGLNVSKQYYPVGTVIAEAAEDITFDFNVTDGKIYWTEPQMGLTFKEILDLTTFTYFEGDTFDKRGDYIVNIEKVLEDYNYSSSVVVHVYDPDDLVTVELEADDFVCVTADTTEEDLRAILQVIATFDDASTEEVFDYEMFYSTEERPDPERIEFDPESVTSITVKYGSKTCKILVERYNEDVFEDEDEEDEASSDGTDIFEYLRFIDLDEDEFSVEDIDAIIDAVKAIYEENKELFDAVFTKEITATDATFRVVLNEELDKDLLAIVNLFLGIPGEDGWENITEQYLIESISGIDTELGIDVAELIEHAVGASLENILGHLECEVKVSWKGGISFSLALIGSEEIGDYIDLGISVKAVPAAEGNLYKEDDLVKTQDFETFEGFAIIMAMQLLAA